MILLKWRSRLKVFVHLFQKVAGSGAEPLIVPLPSKNAGRGEKTVRGTVFSWGNPHEGFPSNRRRRGASRSGRMAPHFLTPRNGGKNREGLCPFEPHAFFSTSDLRPLSLVTAGQICADAQDWPAGGGNLPKLAWGIIWGDSVRWGTALRKLANSTQLLKRNFPGEACKIMLQTANWR